MEKFKKVTPREFDGAFDKIGKEWMLITASGKDENGVPRTNTMTASWGGVGVLFNKPVVFCFVRPQRYTYRFLEESPRFSLSFLPEQYRDALRLCGSKSGKDIDKFKAADLNPRLFEEVPFVGEASEVLVCRKLYAGDLAEAHFLDKSLLSNYAAGDFHRVYIAEIEAVLRKESET